ncbi:MAG TPA: DUF167 domain-containing protein [Actinomycetota bacterium]|jgi:uncharacterized protein YggU (UPF0235/DUF167 family)|nr:DUF167 domain-containing protein [Actinomycetota bacterium]
MAVVTVRVVPRSGRTAVEVEPSRGVVVRVRSAPEAGRATAEALRALASAIGIAPSRIRLRSGTRSRTKVYAVSGLTQEELDVRLSAT